MTGDLYKKIILFLLVINVYVYSNTLDRQNYIFSDFIPIQESKTSIGFKLFQSIDSEIDMKIEKSLLLTNWFTNNLYMTGSVSSIEYDNDISLEGLVYIQALLTFIGNTCLAIAAWNLTKNTKNRVISQ